MSHGQFWLNWVVQLAIAAGTISAVFVALFGGWLRSQFVPPRLRISLANPRGEATRARLTDPTSGSVREEDARWYHVKVENLRRWSPATQVQVFLLRVEEPDPVGSLKGSWTGDVPLRWRHQEVHPLTRTIGHAVDCDLCSVMKDKWVSLEPIIIPFSLKTIHRDRCHLAVTLQARSVETDSNLLRVEIAWDGQWADGAEEMSRHMVVRQM